jgi:CDP-6-deoxy-D-xylo-4-hexulose-3-dehydrase
VSPEININKSSVITVNNKLAGFYFIGDEQIPDDETPLHNKLSKLKGVEGVGSLPKSDPCWFGTPFVCESKTLKDKLVSFLEENKIQTRNYFAGNILMHPAYSHLDDMYLYPNSNQVLDKVFFLGASPHYTEEVFDYVESVFKEKWEN